MMARAEVRVVWTMVLAAAFLSGPGVAAPKPAALQAESKAATPAAGGALPKGPKSSKTPKTPEAPTEATTAPAAVDPGLPATTPVAGAAPQGSEAKGRRERPCRRDFANPPGGNGVFSRDGKALYLFANTTSSGMPQPRHTLYRIDVATLKAEVVLSLSMKQDPSLVIYGEPAGGVTAVAHLDRAGTRGAECFAGPAGIVTVSFAKGGGKAVYGKGEYELVREAGGYALVDQKKNQILEIDTASFQTRTKRKTPTGERPLYFDGETGALVAFRAAPPAEAPARTLIAYKNGVAGRRLKLKPADRLAQDGQKFAVMQVNAGDNALTLVEVPGWNGGAKPGSFTVTLPVAYPVAGAGLEPHIGTRRAIVFGASTAARRSWRKPLMVDYGRNKAPMPLGVAAAQFAHYVGFEPRGNLAFVETRTLAEGRTAALLVYSFESGKTVEIKLPPPPNTPRN
jgi:hypothetical protein